MSSESAQEPTSGARRSRKRALHLLWTVPIALAASYIPLALAHLIMCGESGFFCYHDGVTPEQGWTAFAWCVLSGAFMFLAVVLVPWTRWAVLRLLVALAAGLAWTALVWLYALS